MAEKKTDIWLTPVATSAAFATFLSLIAGHFHLDEDHTKLVNTLIPPLSLLLSYGFSWLTAKFYTFSIAEIRALSRLKAREKLVRGELKKGGISTKLQKELQKELDDIVRAKSQIGKSDSIVKESDS